MHWFLCTLLLIFMFIFLYIYFLQNFSLALTKAALNFKVLISNSIFIGLCFIIWVMLYTNTIKRIWINEYTIIFILFVFINKLIQFFFASDSLIWSGFICKKTYDKRQQLHIKRLTIQHIEPRATMCPHLNTNKPELFMKIMINLPVWMIIS